ncbi:MAG: thiamine diphosphokinase [Spirochaetaceae bacterium]|nr:MAG: thiamine diphosphokinase [Spirochaetaceae bacterium]
MKVLVYCNGQPLEDALFSKCFTWADLVIAADGGAYNVFKHGVHPALIIGDLDSFTDQAPAGVKVIHNPDQESNDLQKALRYAAENSASEVLVAGVVGDRLDHELNNLSVLLEYSHHFDSLSFIDNFGRSFVAERTQKLETAPGKVVSLFPLAGAVEGIVTQDLRYPLRNESLEPGVRNGCLNEALSPTVTISHQSGVLLLMVQH